MGVVGAADGWPLFVLIGPAGAGKSTVGSALARRLGTGLVDLDAVAPALYAEAGQPLDELLARIAADGYPAAHRWFQPARAHAVIEGMRRHVDDGVGVVALGARHSHFEDEEPLGASVAAELGRWRERRGAVVVLLLPDLVVERAVWMLRERCLLAKGHDWNRDGVDYLHEWCVSAQNRRLADAVVADRGRTPAEVAAEIARRTRRS